MQKRATKVRLSNKKLSRKTLNELKKAEEFKVVGEYEEAIIVLERVLSDDPECLEALEELADNLLSIDEFDKAEKVAEFALSINKNSFIANHIIGFLELHGEKWISAIKKLKIANEGSPNNPEILRCLGWGLYHANKKKEGLVTLERALNINNDNAMILCDLGVCFLQENKIKKAKNLFEKAFLVDPDNERVNECLTLAKKIEKNFKD